MTVTEGKFHEVKNLIAACGKRVMAMGRMSMGGLQLDKKLEIGMIRRLSEEEVASVLYKDI